MSGDLVLTHSSNQLSLSGGNLSLGTNSLLLTGSLGATGARITKGWFTNMEITNELTVNGSPLSSVYVPTSRTVNSKALTGNISITASDVGLGNVTNESKTTMFTDPTFTGTLTMPTSWYIGTELMSVTGAELNRLSGITVNSSEMNNLSGVSGNIQQQLDGKLSSYNASFTGTTIMDAIQIGRSDSAIVIGGFTDVGTGFTVLKDGVPITYNFPPENLIQIQDIAGMKYSSTMNLSAGAVSTHTTTITTEPYSINILDSSDNDITESLDISWTMPALVYVLNVYYTKALSNVKIKILY